MKVLISKENANIFFETLVAGEGNESVCRIGLIRGKIDPVSKDVEIVAVDMFKQISTMTTAEIDHYDFLKNCTEKDKIETIKSYCGFVFYSPINRINESYANRELRSKMQIDMPNFPFAVSLIFNKNGEYRIYHH